MAAQGKRSTGAPRKGGVLRRLVKPVLAIGVVLALLGALAVVVLYKAIDIPDPNAEFETETTHVYYRGGKQEVGQFALQKRDRLSYEEMPQVIKDAVVAAEDRSFWTNPGIDVKGILRAAFSNASGNETQGASTITQQYVKILYLTSERSYERKIKEAVVARKVAEDSSKEEVLAGYLNTIYFGRGAYGVQAAAVTWFGKDAADLTLREAAVLASVINNPTLYDPANGEHNRLSLENRMKRVLGGMVEMGKITSNEAERAGAKLPKFAKGKAESVFAGQRGHAMALVKKELLRLGVATETEIDGGGLKIYTTLDKKVMEASQQAMDAVRPEGKKDLHAAIASVEPGTGALRGFHGGQDYLESQVNWAIAGGQVGSTFKPFALAAGLEAGYSLKDTFDGNSPYYYNGEGTGPFVVNEDEGYDHGRVNLIKATEKSINSAYADLTMSIPDGPATIVETANRLGIPKKGPGGIDNLYKSPGLEPFNSVALGPSTIAPVNMANAYGTFANGGQAARAYVIEKVVDRNGEVLYKHRTKTRQAVSEDIAADVTYAMQQVVKSGTGTAAGAVGRPAAGKTGTATADDPNGGKDFTSAAWFVGYTPQLSTAVMYTRSDERGRPQPLEEILDCEFGGCYPARTWAATMSAALEGEPVESFPPPAFVDGDAPESGHAPAPTKTAKPKPTKTATAKPKPKPKPVTKTPSVTPSTSSSSPAPGPDCVANPNHPACPKPEDPCVENPDLPECEPDQDGASGTGGCYPKNGCDEGLLRREEHSAP